MADEIYEIPENPQYDPSIRKLQNTDPANAETIFNPLFSRLIENTAAVKKEGDTHRTDPNAHSDQWRVIAVRPRAAGKPTYGLGGGGGGTEADNTIALELGDSSEDTEYKVTLNGVEYAARNFGTDGDASPDGTIIIKELED